VYEIDGGGDLNTIANLTREGIWRWFEEILSKVVGNGRKTLFWKNPWVKGDTLDNLFNRLFDLSLDKDKSVADMILEEMGLNGVGEEDYFIGRRRW
jgi:hypothetical protein